MWCTIVTMARQQKAQVPLVLWRVQVQTDISVDTKQQTLQGVAFPIHKDAVAALERFRDKKLNYVQLVSP